MGFLRVTRVRGVDRVDVVTMGLVRDLELDDVVRDGAGGCLLHVVGGDEDAYATVAACVGGGEDKFPASNEDLPYVSFGLLSRDPDPVLLHANQFEIPVFREVDESVKS
jgi:hypothetical protein